MDINDLKEIGLVIKYNNEPYQIIFSQHSRAARGGAFVRTKLKNLITGQTLEKTFNSSDKIKKADIEKIKASFLYADEKKSFFMNKDNYEQFFLKNDSLGNKNNFLKEGETVEVLLFNNEPVNINLPQKVDLRVIESPPNIKGDSATSPTKNVILETGASLNVPIFIKKNDLIKVNTETGEYVSRVS
jgi:elongation factor P